MLNPAAAIALATETADKRGDALAVAIAFADRPAAMWMIKGANPRLNMCLTGIPPSLHESRAVPAAAAEAACLAELAGQPALLCWSASFIERKLCRSWHAGLPPLVPFPMLALAVIDGADPAPAALWAMERRLRGSAGTHEWWRAKLGVAPAGPGMRHMARASEMLAMWSALRSAYIDASM